MKKTLLVTLCFVILLICVQARKTSRSRSSGSGRGTSRKTNSNPQPAPTSFSNPQASAPKPTLFGWQEKPSHNTQTYNSQSKTSSGQSHSYPASHSYPSSNTGLSGNSPAKQPPSYGENVQKSNVPQQNSQRLPSPSQTNSQTGHSYPSSNGLSGNSGSAGYPQSPGLSGSGSATGHGATGVGNPSYSGSGVGYPQGSGASGAGGPGYKPGTSMNGNYPSQAVGNGYHPPQGPPPPYSGHGYNHGGYGHGQGYNPSYGSPQMPGYFGNYGGYGQGGFGGVSRSGSALKGIGIAGAGVGTILTGLALWNLARSTGHHHHTVVYDNRGQPVAVAPANGTAPPIDPILQDLVNCTLTISSENSTEVLAIPCAIATSFTPEADVKEDSIADGKVDNTKCTVTVVKKTGKEFMTTIPCSILLNSAAENNVTEPPLLDNIPEVMNVSTIDPFNNATSQLNEPSALRLTGDSDKNDTKLINCESILENGEVRDPINPCFAIANNLTVIPLEATSAQPDTGHNK